MLSVPKVPTGGPLEVVGDPAEPEMRQSMRGWVLDKCDVFEVALMTVSYTEGWRSERTSPDNVKV